MFVARVAGFQSRRLGDEVLKEGSEDSPLDKDSLGADAVLSGSQKEPETQASTAVARSASSNTMTGALPPSSMDKRLIPAFAAIARPVAKPPVKETMRTSLEEMMVCAIVRSPRTTVTNSAGSPASRSRSTRRMAVNGVSCDGFRITVLPPAIAGGPSLWATKFKASL